MEALSKLPVDALDKRGQTAHRRHGEKGGSHRCSVRRHWIWHRQGPPLLELALEDFSFYCNLNNQFLTARSAARRMVTKRSGVILKLSASPARMAIPLTGGFGVACAAIEGLSSRSRGAQPSRHRIICLRSHRIGDTLPMDPESLRWKARASGNA